MADGWVHNLVDSCQLLVVSFSERILLFLSKASISNEILDSSKKLELNWYVAKCIRPDLTAYSVHTHQLSGNSSGEHNF